MATGIEIAGLVLAILPLCITAVEHHSDALSPFVTIVRHRREHRRRLQDLGVCLVLLEETIKGVLEASGIVGGIDVASFSDACVSQLWRDKGEESRIIAHFGTKIYKYSFVVTIDRIREDLVEIQSILGLPSGGSTAGANSTMWSRVVEACERPSNSNARPTAQQSISSRFIERTNFAFRSGSIGKYLKRLKEHTHELSEIASFAGKQGMQVQANETSSQRPKATALRDIKNHAQRLHAALQDFRRCKTHVTHCVNLQLGQALPTGSNRDIAAFNIAFASDPATKTWSALNICVPAEREDLTPYSNNSSKVKFHLEPPLRSTSAPFIVAHDLCAHVLQSNASDTNAQFRLNEHGQIVLWKGAAPVTSPLLTGQQRESIKSFVHRQHVADRNLTLVQTLQLSVIVVSTFLQLSTTHWVPDTWCSEDIFFLKPKDSVDIDQTYISIECKSAACVGTLDARAASDDSNRLLRLGVILLEICAQKSIEDLRSSIEQIANLNFSMDLSRDLTTIREFVKREQAHMLPCFHTAIIFCMTAYVRGAMNLEDQAERQQVIDEVLCPLERCLQC